MEIDIRDTKELREVVFADTTVFCASRIIITSGVIDFSTGRKSTTMVQLKDIPNLIKALEKVLTEVGE